jgi:hypothetical protein
MREVPVPTAFAAHSFRRPIVLMAAWLVVLQAFLVGLLTARSGALLDADPIGVVCHGSPGTPSGASPADAPDPDAAKVRHLCCVSCLPAVPAIATAGLPRLFAPRRDAPGLKLAAFLIVLMPGARRAGSSRSPPRTPA